MNQFQASGMSLPDDTDEPSYVSSETESKEAEGSSAPKKRASRAGTRSVNSLTTAQLERKRANDRDAQRAIRKRTKDHIEGLERRVSELTVKTESLERVNAVLEAQSREMEGRNRQLSHENDYLRSRMGNEGFMMRTPNAERGSPAMIVDPASAGYAGQMLTPSLPSAKPTDQAMVSQVGQSSPELHFSSHEMPRPIARHSIPILAAGQSPKPEAWRPLQQPAVLESTDPSSGAGVRVGPARSNSWRQQGGMVSGVRDAGQATPNEAQQRRSMSVSTMGGQRSSTWDKGPNYGYMMDMRPQPVSYAPDSKPPSFSDSQSAGQFAMHMGMGNPQGQAPPYGTDLPVQPTAFTHLPLQPQGEGAPGPEQLHDQASYDMSMSQMHPASDYHGEVPEQRHDSLQRASITSSSYGQGPSGSGAADYPQPGTKYPGNPNPAAYQYGQYHGRS